MCFYTTHAECGVPTMTPTGEQVGEMEFYAIQYDDHDVESGFNNDSDGIILPSKFSPLDKIAAEYDYYSNKNFENSNDTY